MLPQRIVLGCRNRKKGDRSELHPTDLRGPSYRADLLGVRRLRDHVSESDTLDRQVRRSVLRLVLQLLGLAGLLVGCLLIVVFAVASASIASCPYVVSSGLCPLALGPAVDLFLYAVVGTLTLAGGIVAYRRGFRSPPPGPGPPSSGPSGPFPRRRRIDSRSATRLVVIGAIVATVVVILASVPVNYSFSGELATSCWPACSSDNVSYTVSGAQAVPANSQVTVSWEDVSGGFVTFGINIFVDNRWVGCTQEGPDGDCILTSPSTGNLYTVSVSDENASEGVQIVTYAGTFTAPAI